MTPLLRMLDANANRAAEALRVMEDAARFALDDAPLTAELKSIRHGVREGLEALESVGADRAALLAWRDTARDVGATISTAAEAEREGLAGVALAAGKRAAEALRSMEECAKALGGAGAPAFETLRYRVYEADRRLGLALAGGRAAQWRLCVIVTEALCRRPWLEVARLAVEAGADCVQLREKTLPDAELLRRARALVRVSRECAKGDRGRAAVIINDRPDIALLSGADGVHVGQGDLPVTEVRRLAGERVLIGVSASTIAEAHAAAAAGTDYCGVGAMFPTATKRKDAIAGVGLMREYARHEPALPAHLAIGGITASNAAEVAEAGARGIAVCAAVCGAERPDEATAALLEALGAAGRAPAGAAV